MTSENCLCRNFIQVRVKAFTHMFKTEMCFFDEAFKTWGRVISAKKMPRQIKDQCARIQVRLDRLPSRGGDAEKLGVRRSFPWEQFAHGAPRRCSRRPIVGRPKRELARVSEGLSLKAVEGTEADDDADADGSLFLRLSLGVSRGLAKDIFAWKDLTLGP